MDQTDDGTELDPVVDTRFQVHRKLYIRDLLGADLSDFDKFKTGVAKIKGHYVHKVTFSGMVVDVKEMDKGYRLKIDDSTGAISAMVWRSKIFQDENLDSFESASSSAGHDQSNGRFKEENQKLFQVLDSIKSCIKDKSKNNWIVNEPTPGDLVMIKGTIETYMNQLSIKVIKCIRIQNINDELINMVLPAVLDKVYSIPPPTNEDFERLKSANEKKQQQQQPQARFKLFNEQSPRTTKQDAVGRQAIDPAKRKLYLECVLKSLKQVAKDSGSSRSSHVFDINKYLNSAFAKELPRTTYHEVLGALQELEAQGLIYSCESDQHYLPIM